MKIALTLAAIALVLTGTLIWGINDRSSAYFDDRCFANFTYNDSNTSDALKFEGNILFEFSKSKTGQFTLFGDMTYQGKSYTFSRYVNFDYLLLKNNVYRIKILSQEAMPHDTVPTEIAPLAVKIFFLTGEHSMYLHKHDDSFITIGNTLSPLMNCVIEH